MRVQMWIFLTAVILLFSATTAVGQKMDVNTLCLNGGSGYKLEGPYWGFPNHGASKYFPSYAHIPATSVDNLGLVYPWKLAGWGWTGMMVDGGGDYWYWESSLMRSVDNPYSPNMSFDYPQLYGSGTIPHSGWPMPIYGGQVPTSVPIVGGNLFQFPSSMGGYNAYMNLFATVGASFVIPSTQPDTPYDFGFIWDCASAITVPSNCSIWESVWTMKGPSGQYMVFSCEGDCNQSWWAGNKGRNYSITMDSDNGFIWYWTNGCTGTGEEMDMGLFLCDAITIPVNIPGAYWGTPYTSYGFDVGTACLTPYLSSNNLQLGFMTQDYTGAGGDRIILAAFSLWLPVGPFGKHQYRLPHGWDLLTNLFLNIPGIFQHKPTLGYPASMFGTTYGAHSNFLNFPYDPLLLAAEITYSSFPLNPGQPPSAGFRVTYF